jgi:Transglycosylase SLT domain
VAGEIFVGSVAVSVVPDLRGFNDRIRSELVPAANRIGQEIGKEIARGIVESLNIGRAVEDASTKDRVRIMRAGYEMGRVYGSEMKRGIEEALRDITATVKVKADTSLARAEIARVLSGGSTSGKGKVVSDTTDGGFLSKTLSSIAARSLLYKMFGSGKLTPNAGKGGSGSGDGGGGGGFFASLAPGGASPLTGLGQTFSAAPIEVQVGLVAAAIAALPLVAQVAASGIVTALGGAFLAVGIYAAAQTKSVQDAWAKFMTQTHAGIQEIGNAFAPVVVNIIQTLGPVADKLGDVLVGVLKVVGPPFQLFADTIIKGLASPSVVAAMQEIGKAFADLLSAFTPDIPGIINSMAQGVERIAAAVAKNPKAFADFINFLFQIVIMVINGIAYLTDFADYVELHFIPAVKDIGRAFVDVGRTAESAWNTMYNDTVGNMIRIHDAGVTWQNKFYHDTAHIYDLMRHDIAHYWDLIYSDTIGRLIRLHDDGVYWQNKFYHDTAHIYDLMRHDIAATWDATWSDTVGATIRGAQRLMGVFGGLKNSIIGVFRDAGSWLYGAGQAVIQGFWNGMTAIWHKVTGWISSLAGWIKAHKGPLDADLALLQPAGQAIMSGLKIGLLGGFVDIKNIITGAASNIENWFKTAVGQNFFARIIKQGLVDVSKLPKELINVLGKVGGFASSIWNKVFGTGSSGVGQWAGTVAQALALLGLPQSLGSRVLYQMQTESGGNPNAINLTDINAQMGDPSRGLMQVIGSTFAQYHVAGTSGNIYDPLANIAAAIAYASYVYGPTLMRGGMGIGSGHGYDEGGWVPPGLSLFNNGTGQPELAIPADQLRKYGAQSAQFFEALSALGPQYHAHFDGLTGAAIESHVQVAFKAMSLTAGALNRQGRRS